MTTQTIEQRAALYYQNLPPHAQDREGGQLIKLLVEEIERLKADKQVETLEVEN
jgi:hypothetical protein